MGLKMLLTALGVNVTPENVAAIEALIPQIPARANQIIAFVNAAVTNFDARLKVVETNLDEIKELLRQNGNGHNTTPTGPGTKQLTDAAS